MFVLKRNEDGMYVAPPGSEHSYVRSLQKAWGFATREGARAHACGNEHVVNVDEEIYSEDKYEG